MHEDVECGALRSSPHAIVIPRTKTHCFIMFYQLTLTKTMDVHPRHFGKNLSEIIGARLIEEVRWIRNCPAMSCHLGFSIVDMYR